MKGHKPVEYQLKTMPLEDLVIGYTNPHGVRWECPPYDQRPGPNHHHAKAAHGQANYDRLEASIRAHGISDPLIVWTHPETGQTHVLIGMRRAEIGRKLGIQEVRVAEVTEDVREWTPDEVHKRQPLLKEELGQRPY